MADVWSEIAGLLVQQGRLEEAIAAYKRLVEIAPHDPSALVTVAQAARRARRLDEAQAQAETAREGAANRRGPLARRRAQGADARRARAQGRRDREGRGRSWRGGRPVDAADRLSSRG